MASPTRDSTRDADPALAWVAHLRAGGTEPWASWRSGAERPPRGASTTPRSAPVPGAQQLELLRRLNLAARARRVTPSPALVERVVNASAPGRGIPDLPLLGTVPGPHRFGPRPVDPAGLAAGELVRVASGLLAEDLVAAGVPAEAPAGFRRPWAPSYRISGDPWLVWPVVDQLGRRGRGPGGRRPQWVVVGTDLPTMLTHAWVVRSLDSSAIGWDDWLTNLRSVRSLPRRADTLGAVRRAAAHVGVERVTVVLDPARVPGVLGTRRRVRPMLPLGADAADLARRVAAPLGGLVLPDRRARLLRHTLLPRLLALGDLGGRPLAVPPEHTGWVVRRATRLRRGLLATGCTVVGDPDVLLRTPEGRDLQDRPDDQGTLDLALRLLLVPEGDRPTEKGPTPG
ncbi:hypothetical protein [Nocardioides dongxiaopingii]|uniref:hypothetical protein n=1 Tax=Nocardioides dongxiaopingii TaxID=2576036 RepID=UPI0010C76F65|nr:hypothetical protein [Nocardioides dongxiaopingii]